VVLLSKIRNIRQSETQGEAMRIGVPKEIKAQEDRVAITPAGVAQLLSDGHEILIESKAGLGSGFSDEDYARAGAKVLGQAGRIWQGGEMILKVKEPLPSEYGYFRPDMVLFTYLHLAAEESLTMALLESGITAIAYETVQLPDCSLPLLVPMSEVAGRMAAQIGANLLTRHYGGKGILPGGVPGVPAAQIVIVGGGTVGANAAKVAAGLGARVTVLDSNMRRLAYLDDILGPRVQTMASNEYNLARYSAQADVLIGAVLIPGSKAPKLVSEDMVKGMSKGSVIVDVAIDQGGSIATIDHSTTHDAPTYERHGVIHYAVANMPGSVPRTSTLALTNVVLGYARQLAAKGWRQACRDNPALAQGINMAAGCCVYPAVGEAFALAVTPLDEILYEK
jgi:alanine dehydrogenase